MSAVTLPGLLSLACSRTPQATALLYLDHAIPYVLLNQHVLRAATGLSALGVRPGDRVALMLPNCPQFVIAYFATLHLGAIVTATSPAYTAREAAHQWQDAGASCVIVDARLLPVATQARAHCPAIAHIVATNDHDYSAASFPGFFSTIAFPSSQHPGDTLTWSDLLCTPGTAPACAAQADALACLQYTGGTTGLSKGAMLTHANFVINLAQTRDRLTNNSPIPEFSVAALPFFHIFAMTCVMLSALETGGTILILPRFEPRSALDAICRHRPRFFHGVPTMYVGFLNLPGVSAADFASLRYCVSGGAPLPLEVLRKFEALIPQTRISEGYGLSECSPVTHFNSPRDPHPGSIGWPVMLTEARIVELDTGQHEMPDGEPGELVIRGPQVMAGYWQKPDETAAAIRDGWFHTGDIAVRAADGVYTIVDRKKDLIIAGGFNIYPREIEDVLFEHPFIREALVIGVPDAYRGETVKAFVSIQPGTTLTAEELITFCRDHLAPYKVPRLVEFRDALPRSGVGKLLRRELRREELEERRPINS